MTKGNAMSEEVTEDFDGESRINLGTAAFMNAALSAICALSGPQQLRLHTSAPGITGAGLASAVAAKAIAWGTPTGGGAAISTVTATPVQFDNVPAGTYTHYGVYATNGTTFLYGKPFAASVVIPAGATGTVTVTPTHTYDLQ
jgi:hypothetical protein